jgi:predicted DsbA family dithiol-disulfide isomerase
MDDAMPTGMLPAGATEGTVCGPDGGDGPKGSGTGSKAGTASGQTAPTAAATPAAAPAAGTRIDIVSDAICPWCYVGKRHLEAALAELSAEGLHFSVHWNPFQLNPDMPREGVDRAAYRAAKFGSAERAREIDARVGSAAAAAGLAFRQDLMRRTPNTIDAHRLIWFAGRQDPLGEPRLDATQPRETQPRKTQPGTNRQDAVMEAVFRAYFIEGRDIGDVEVLADCAAEAGLDRAAVAAFLHGDVAAAEMRAADQAAREAGVDGVPAFFLDGYSVFSGAMPAAQMAEAFRRGRRILREPEA